MTSMWYPPTFLALPLEIRHNIYSYLLIHKWPVHLVEIQIFEENPIHPILASLLHTCRQVCQEAFEFYFSKNTFLLTLITPYYNLCEIAAESNLLERQLRLVQNLHVVIKTSSKQRLSCLGDNCDYPFPPNSKYPKQQAQWDCFVELTLRSKEGPEARTLRELVIRDQGGDLPEHGTALEEIEAILKVYPWLLARLRGKNGQILVRKDKLSCISP